MMKPYWVTFIDPPFGLGLGIGVTAGRELEAEKLALRAAGEDAQIREVKWVQAATELDQNHVVPNMGHMLGRGVWLPRGYEHLQ